MTTTPETKTDAMLAACKGRSGATVEQMMDATGQSKQTIRSRIYTLTKAGRITPVDGTSPRRYKVAKPAAKKASNR